MDTEKFKSKLLELKQELESRTSRTHEHIYHKQEPVSANFSEQVKQMENDDLVAALESEGLKELGLINSALERIDNSEFGYCQQCGEMIGQARLEAIPYAECCIGCTT
jgi:DnaK suppressor protein